MDDLSYRGMSSDNITGLVLALSSSFFIGASFIVKKKGLKKAGSSGVRAEARDFRSSQGYKWPDGENVGMNVVASMSQNLVGVIISSLLVVYPPWRKRIGFGSFFSSSSWLLAYVMDAISQGAGGYSYLYEPLWWTGMITMVVGEIANFTAYAFAPAILVTPLGALSIIISAVLAYAILKEKLHIFGILGCILCVVGSITIVLHAPQERQIESVAEVWDLATEPAFLFYAAVILATAFVLIVHYVPEYGQTHIMVYIGVCSLVGSLSVMSVKALGIALKLTFSGMNQFKYSQTWVFVFVVAICVLTQMNYLNKALDTFNTAVVSPIYYVMFTSLTIVASVIMFKDWDRQNPTQIFTEMCGFVTILSGTFLLHRTKDMADGLPSPTSRLPKHEADKGFHQEGIPLKGPDNL